MKPEHLHILQHSLGLNQYGLRESGQQVNSDDWNGCYRNGFVTGADSPDGRHCTELVALGYMIDHGEQKMFGKMHCFQVTQAGFEAMRAASPRPPKLTKSQQRWERFLSFKDATGGDFKAFLRYAKQRGMPA